jgi:hypothetical protein
MGQQIRHEQFGKFRVIANSGGHGRLIQASDHATINGRPRGCNAPEMAVQASFAKEMAGSHDCNHRFLALLGSDGELDLVDLPVREDLASGSPA